MAPPSPARPTTDPRAYFASPTTHVLEGRRFRCATPDGRLFLLIAWGHLEVEDSEELVPLFEACAELAPPDRLQLVILRDVVGVAPRALSTLIRYYAGSPAYLQGIAREAVVRPGGDVALLAGPSYDGSGLDRLLLGTETR